MRQLSLCSARPLRHKPGTLSQSPPYSILGVNGANWPHDGSSPARRFLRAGLPGPGVVLIWRPCWPPSKSLRAAPARCAQFLGGRLAGYLGFACIAWLLGLSLRFQPRRQALIYGLADLGLAIFLGGYAWAMRAGGLLRPAVPRRPGAPLCATVQEFRICYSRICERPHIVPAVRRRRCPRRGKAEGWPIPCSSLVFFGTSIWFAPSVGLGMLRRFAAVGVVARLTLFLLAGYYGNTSL